MIFFFQNFIDVKEFNRNQSLGLLSSSVNLGGTTNPLTATAFDKRRFSVTCENNLILYKKLCNKQLISTETMIT